MHFLFVSCTSIRSTPTYWDWRDLGKVSPVRNVGSCSSCWAVAAVDAVESKILILEDVLVNLSEQQIISCGGAGDCNGGSPARALNYIRDHGIEGESCSPYLADDDIPCKSCQGQLTKIEGYFSISYGSDVEDKIAKIKEAVYLNGPIIVWLDAGCAQFYNYSGGITPACTGTPNCTMLLVGWNDSQEYWIVKNAWNTWWGEDGYVRIAMRTANSSLYTYPPIAIKRTDINGDGTLDGLSADSEPDLDVDGKELSRLISEFGRNNCSTQNPCGSDYNRDGAVEAADLLIFLDEYGVTLRE